MTRENSTPPKGRPTRGRNETGRRRGAFGPTAQWIAVIAGLLMLFLLLFLYMGNRSNAGAGEPPTAPPAGVAVVA